MILALEMGLLSREDDNYCHDYASQSNEKRITVDAAQTGLKVKKLDLLFRVLNGWRDFFRSREK